MTHPNPKKLKLFLTSKSSENWPKNDHLITFTKVESKSLIPMVVSWKTLEVTYDLELNQYLNLISTILKTWKFKVWNY